MPSETSKIIRRLLDIRENIDAASSFISGATREQFCDDMLMYYAVTRALEIISEASRHVPNEIKERHPNIQWRAIRDSGNAYRHGYLSISLDVVWATVARELTPLREAVVGELRALGIEPE